jgi:hypothetical protein
MISPVYQHIEKAPFSPVAASNKYGFCSLVNCEIITNAVPGNRRCFYIFFILLR